MLIDCPHCFTRVMPKADGCCPACQKDTRSAAGIDPVWTSIRVSQGDILPPVCCDCGRETNRTVAVCQTTSSKETSPGWVKAALVAIFSFFWAMVLAIYNLAGATTAKVRLPQCEACGRRGPPQPRYVDFANGRMTFLVHTNLRQAMKD